MSEWSSMRIFGLLQAPCRTGTFNVCSGVGRSLRWLLEETGRLAGHQLVVKINPDLVRSSDAARMIGSNRKLVEAIGPLQHLDFSKTLRWMLKDMHARRQRPAKRCRRPGPSVDNPRWPSYRYLSVTQPSRVKLADRRVLVVGDVMLDRYWFGDVERISPEAPVPVVRIDRMESARRRCKRRAQHDGPGRTGGAADRCRRR
jgi:hypothetical protein